MSVIMELPSVLECGVSPVPDEIRGAKWSSQHVLTKGTMPCDSLARKSRNTSKKHTAPYNTPRRRLPDELP
jgi:acetyl-CoA synthetase